MSRRRTEVQPQGPRKFRFGTGPVVVLDRPHPFEGLVVIGNPPIYHVLGPPVGVVAPSQIELIRLGIVGVTFRESFLFLPSEL